MARIAIIEDERDIVSLYRTVLEQAGHVVVGAWDDPAALLRSLPDPAPDVVILDERLRGLSGLSFMSDLRRLMPRTRIIVATADPAALDGANRHGADAVLRKPFALRRLLEDVERLALPQGA